MAGKLIALIMLAMAPATLWAAMSLWDARGMVKSMQGESEPAQAVMDALVEDGIALREATALAVSAADSDQYRVSLAEAALCMARGEEEFEEVGIVAISAAGEAGSDGSVIESIAAFRPGACGEVEQKTPPGTLTGGSSTAQGGLSEDDVSPSS